MSLFLLEAAKNNPSIGEVVGIGIGIVFVGLICLIFMMLLMSWILKVVVKDKPATASAAAPVAATSAPVSAEIPNRAEFVAAVSAVIAEELGTDISKIEIKSIKKL